MSGEASAAFWAWVEALRAEHLKFSGLIPKEITALDAWVACWAQKEAELAALRAERDALRAAVEEIEERTRPNGDMAGVDVNLVARAALGER